MRDQKIQIDVKRRAPESYAQMKERQQREVNGFPLAFAFSDRQFAEGMRALDLDPTDKDKIVSIGGGGFIRKADEDAFTERCLYRRMWACYCALCWMI